MRTNVHPLTPFSEFMILILTALTIVGVLLVFIGIRQLRSGKRFGLVYLIIGLVLFYPVVASFFEEGSTQKIIELEKQR